MEETEIRLKEIIIERYGSLKKFCETIDMPWTTLDSILKRGVANSNITNVMKITRELQLDTEALASGTIKKALPSPDFAMGVDGKLVGIIETYKKLPTISQKRLEQYATALLNLSSLEGPMLNAAHAFENASEEDKKHDEDIMDDENF